MPEPPRRFDDNTPSSPRPVTIRQQSISGAASPSAAAPLSPSRPLVSTPHNCGSSHGHLKDEVGAEAAASAGTAPDSMAQLSPARSSPPASSTEHSGAPCPPDAPAPAADSGHPCSALSEGAMLPTAAIASRSATSQRQLNDYREKLARHLQARESSARGLPMDPSDRSRVSPIPEEAFSSLPPPLAGPSGSVSAASDITARVVSASAPAVGTPSYPFPRMVNAPVGPSNLNKPMPFHHQHHPSPAATRAHPSTTFNMLENVVSEASTPASNYTFNLSVTTPYHAAMHEYPDPNLFDLSLMLSAEPGLDVWWSTVVHIMRDVYKAERVTLSVPADSTDLENVPWGQKATYSENEGNQLSMGYMAHAGSPVQSSELGVSDLGLNMDDMAKPSPPARPRLSSRHSFTTYEDNKQKARDRAPASARRPAHLVRSKSHFQSAAAGAAAGAAAAPHRPADLPSPGHTALNKDALEEHDAAEARHHQPLPSWEAPLVARLDGRGRVLPVLQALDYEADPLIDHTGIQRVLQRGRAVALTRSYPYLPTQTAQPTTTTDQQNDSKTTTPKLPSSDATKKYKRPRAESASKLSSILPGPARPKSNINDKTKSAASHHPYDDEDDEPRPPTPKYEEYEQAPPSPWSQSPAPSPAVRAEPKESPFFTDAMVDESSFDPATAPASYSDMPPPEAIGVDNSWTVLHIPLTHVLLSRPLRPFRLSTMTMDQRSQGRQRDRASEVRKDSQDPEGLTSERSATKNGTAPIAILSILSPIIPYPSNLRRSLDHLAPHMATSFSLCRHYTNLETELAGIQRRRPPTAGFGAVAPFPRLGDPGPFVVPPSCDSSALQPSIVGSMTSPSDFSAVSKSAAGSPLATPGWEQGSLNHLVEKRHGSAPSPPVISHQAGENYFSSKQKPGMTTKLETPCKRSRPVFKDVSSPDPRLALSPAALGPGHLSAGVSPHADKITLDVVGDTGAESRQGSTHLRPAPEAYTANSGEPGAASSSTERLGSGNQGLDASRSHHHHGHSVLHSYGADFASTFQSLPPSSSLLSRPTPSSSALQRSTSMSSLGADMLPPSDRLKGLILDSLPTHVFVSLPQTGETVWVNSRFLSYRGQTVADLAADPWGSIHPDDRDGYLKAWSHSLRTGEQFSRTVRIKRFDGAYRWFYARAVASKDKRGVIVQFLGSYMDIHDQHIAELRAARQEEVEASDAKHRLLANLIPQIIFTATEDEGITFANEQWLSYTGQTFEESLSLGFMDHVHPDDLARCRIPLDHCKRSRHNNKDAATSSNQGEDGSVSSETASSTCGTIKGLGAATATATAMAATSETGARGGRAPLSRSSSSDSDSTNQGLCADLTEMARKGIIKVTTDTNGRLSYTTEVRLRAKTGAYRWHLIRCVEIDTIDFGRGVSSYFGSATDINDHKILETKLKEAMESKSRFLSNMSHEIRTPLIGISGMVTFLQDTTLDEEQRDYTNTIQTSANSLIMIINDILDLSKVDAGMMKLKYEWFHTRSLIEDVNELVSTMAIAKRLELNYIVDADVPAWVKGDKVRIRQVLLNVIGNAIKFTAEGEVFSRCQVCAEPPEVEGNGAEIALQFAITDTGRGFSEEEAELIFKPFSQIDGSSTRQHGGSGLGLVISRQLVELHGGKMEGKAELGKGSTFTFTARFALPTADDHPDFAVSPASTTVSVESSRRDSAAAVAMVAAKSSFSPLSPPPPPPPPPSSSSSARIQQVAANGIRLAGGAGTLSLSSAAMGGRQHLTRSATSAGSSITSTHTGTPRSTGRSSSTSVNEGLARFSEAAKASGQDLSQMRLEMPGGRGSPRRAGDVEETTTTTTTGEPTPPLDSRPPLYSILVICPQFHSREATKQHIEMTLPKDVPHHITALATVEEAQRYIGGDDPVEFTHIVLNLAAVEAIMRVMDQVMDSRKMDRTMIVVLSDSVQRQAVLKQATESSKHGRLLTENLLTFIYKPVKPSRFAVIFDPDKVRDLSTDRNRSTAQQMVESQKASYQEIERRMGNKGYKVLLVEDNPVNQKVLVKYLKKIGVDVDIAVDGVECIDQVLSKPHEHFSLILCDLHMPRKDGYQACREIRQWEAAKSLARMPIIALSANVMSDVQDKCFDAGFSDYVTKPVDFIDLSRAMAKFF